MHVLDCILRVCSSLCKLGFRIIDQLSFLLKLTDPGSPPETETFREENWKRLSVKDDVHKLVDSLRTRET